MLLRRRYIFFLLFLLSGCAYLKADRAPKSQQYFTKALTVWSEKDPEAAIKLMRDAIAEDTAYTNAYVVLGRWYMDMHRFDDASELYGSASRFCWDGATIFAKPLALSLMINGQPDKALSIINSRHPKNDTADWNRLGRQAIFIRDAIINQRSVMPVSAGDKINTWQPELFPMVTRDSTALFFTRRVNNMDEDLYQAIMEDTCSEWKSAQELDEDINTINQESAAFISADGHYLFFARSDNRSENGWSNGDVDLFMSYRVREDTDWTTPQIFGATINSPYYEGMPSVSPDNRELFFVSDRPGGYGGLDIWISRFEEGLWQKPVNAGPNINTPGNDMAPFIATDGNTLYFSSDGHPGLGGTDLFVSRKLSDTLWGPAQNLGFPINSSCNELSNCISPDGKKLYFASDRKGPAGNYDIYVCNLPPDITPIPVKYVEGYVYDSLTTDRLNFAQIYITNTLTGDTLYHFQSNRGDASFMITLPTGRFYARHTARTGYTDIDDTFHLDEKSPENTLIKNIAMLPFDYKEIKPINDSLIATIHFDLNRVDLSPKEQLAIKNAITPWLDETGIAIYVNAYTDNTGTPLLNEELSFKRANLVTQELVKDGINELFIISRGLGESKMIAPNETEEGRNKNRRVEIVIKR